MPKEVLIASRVIRLLAVLGTQNGSEWVEDVLLLAGDVLPIGAKRPLRVQERLLLTLPKQRIRIQDFIPYCTGRVNQATRTPCVSGGLLGGITFLGGKEISVLLLLLRLP